MNEEKKSAFSGKKAKILSIAICAAIVLSIGTLTALAANGENFPALPFFKSGENVSGLAIRSDDDGTSYSTDGGETWSDTVPEGVTFTEVIGEDGEAYQVTVSVYEVNPDGGLVEMTSEAFLETRSSSAFPGFSQGNLEYRLSPDGMEYLHMLRVDVEDGKVYHSLDNGETWIEGLPEGVIREGADEYELSFDSEDGSVSFSYRQGVSDDE